MTPEELEAERLEAERLAAEQKKLADEAEAARLAAMTEEERFNERVEKAAEEKLKEIKAKLDNAYKARDKETAKAAKLEEEKRNAEIQRLKDAGKEKEAHDMELADERKKREELERINLELTRDVDLKDCLSPFKFRKQSAYKAAFRDIAEQLVRNDQGVWVHRSGATIAEFVQIFAKDDENDYLFETKPNTGAGTTKPSGGSSGSGDKKSLFSLSQAEVIKRAQAKAAGK